MWDVDDPFAGFASQPTVLSEQFTALCDICRPPPPPSIAPVGARKDRQKKRECGEYLDIAGYLFRPGSKEGSILVVEDHQRILF